MRALSVLCVLAVFCGEVLADDIWRPAPGTSFSWFLAGFDGKSSADAVDLDYEEATAAQVAAIAARGGKTICYVSVGSWEEWRADKAAFPAAIIGKDYEGWPGEKWLDIRRIDTLGPIIEARFDLCKAKGFDGVEPDNMNLHEQDSGFAVTRADQVAFNIWLASEAHGRGLSIGLKNVPDLLPDLIDHYDWALLEDCFVQGWCGDYAPMAAAGKAVFAVEYTDAKISFAKFCAEMAKLNFSGLLKNRSLDAFEKRCPK